jgi:hypothetical protein
MTRAERIADLIGAALPDIKCGSLRVWGVWFGRPYDNRHGIRSCNAVGNTLRIVFNEDEVLSVFSPQRACIDSATFRIEDAEKVLWEWFSYGCPKTRENQHFLEFTKNEVGVVAARTNDVVGVLEPSGSQPAVEML